MAEEGGGRRVVTRGWKWCQHEKVWLSCSEQDAQEEMQIKTVVRTQDVI